MNHTVNLVVVSGIAVFDDTGCPVQIIKIPFITLFFHIPAALYLWFSHVIYRLQPATCHLRFVALLRLWLDDWPAEIDLIIQALVTGGPYWRLIYAR